MRASLHENIRAMIPGFKASIDEANLIKTISYIKHLLHTELETHKLQHMNDLEIPVYPLTYAAKKAFEAKEAGNPVLANKIWVIFEHILQCVQKTPFKTDNNQASDLYKKSLGFAMNMVAAKYSNYPVVIPTLLEMDADQDILIDTNHCLLVRAIHSPMDEEKIISCVMSKAIRNQEPITDNLKTAFFLAIEKNKASFVDIFLLHYPNLLLACDNSKNIPVTLAARAYNWDIFEHLLNKMTERQKGPDRFHIFNDEIRKNLGEAIIYTALNHKKNFLMCCDALLGLGACPDGLYNNESFLFEVIRRDCIKMLNLLLMRGVNVHVLNLKGQNLLHFAASLNYNNTPIIVKSLLEAGADIGQKTPCHCENLCEPGSSKCATAKLPIQMADKKPKLQNLFIDFATKPCGRFVSDAQILLYNLWYMGRGKGLRICTQDGTGPQEGYQFDSWIVIKILMYTNWTLEHQYKSFNPETFENKLLQDDGFESINFETTSALPCEITMKSIILKIELYSLEAAFLAVKNAYIGKMDLLGSKAEYFRKIFDNTKTYANDLGALQALQYLLTVDNTSLKKLVVNKLLASLPEKYAIEDILAIIPPPLPSRGTKKAPVPTPYTEQG